MLTSTIISSQHWYYNEAGFKHISKKNTEKKKIFYEKKTRSFQVNRVSLVTNDGLNILIKAVTCSPVL